MDFLHRKHVWAVAAVTSEARTRPDASRGAGALLRLLAAVLNLVPAVAIGCHIAPSRAQPALGLQEPARGAGRHEVWLVPSQDPRVPMRALVLRPQGPGPFPLAVINHGSVESAELRMKFTQPAFDGAANWFVRRGYAVALPLRPGHGATGGAYLESAGPCERADFRKAGLATADSIEAAIGYLTRQTFIKRDGVVVVGHSAGGWGALALASRNLRAVKAVIAFAPVRGGRVNGRADNNCAPERLIEAAREFGARARVPVLMIANENDTYLSPGLARAIGEAYRRAGGRIEMRALASFGRDGHWLFTAPDGVALWGPLVEEFFEKLQ